MKNLFVLLMVISFAVSCAKESDSDSDGGSSSNDITVAGTMGTASSFGVKNDIQTSSVDLAALKMYCVAFNASASSGSSDFGSDGSFSLSIPADTPFGCFVINKTSAAIVATIKVKDTSTGMSDQSSSSMSLGQSVDMGNITLTEGNPVVEVPIATIEASQSTSSATYEPTDVHGTEWTLTCVDSTDSQCSDFVSDSPTVFLRIVEATKSSETVYGIGVWASSSAFTTCGGVDMTAAEASSIASDDSLTWVTNSTGNFTNNANESDSCPLRDDADGSADKENLDLYYTLSKLVISGNTFSLNDEEDDSSGNCSRYHKTAVTFSPSSSTVMYGSFETAEVVTSGGDCDGDVTDDRASFVVKFTKN